MTLVKSSVSANTERTKDLMDSLHKEFVKLLVVEMPETTGLTYQESMQKIAESAFSASGFADGADSYFLYDVRDVMFRRNDWEKLGMLFEQEMDEKYIYRFIVQELLECGVNSTDPEDSEILIEASSRITSGFLNTIQQYEEISLDLNIFKEAVDESLTTAYEEISGADSA